tara:strand:- start:223 stop:882 length:660 start_codon:yes stop_codon:yes gene_type:complete
MSQEDTMEKPILTKAVEVMETIEEEPKAKKGAKKPRKPMSAEHKAKVIAALAKAREASALSRQKRAEVKKIKKRDADEERDDIIRKDILRKSTKADDKDKKIQELEKRLAGLTLQDVVKKPQAKQPKVKVIDTQEPEVIENDRDFTSTPQVEPNYVSKPMTRVLEVLDNAPLIDEVLTPKVIEAPKTKHKAQPLVATIAQHIQQAPIAVTYKGRGRRRN